MSLPDYAVWTGMVDLEKKLELLEDFAGRGDVDAILLGNSHIDLGFSAEEMSAALSRETGGPVRVFNMALGAARGAWVLEKLYRLARLHARPQRVFVYIVQLPLKEANERATARGDKALAVNPISLEMADTSDFLLASLHELHHLPAVWAAPAVRSLLLHGETVGVPSCPPINSWGDRREFYGPVDAGQFSAEADVQRAAIAKRRQQFPPDRLDALSDTELARAGYGDQVDALRHFKARVEADGAEMVLVVSSASVPWFLDDPFLNDSRSRMAAALGRVVGVSVLDIAGHMTPHFYELLDPVHLNAYGARRVADVAVALDRQLPLPPEESRDIFEGAFPAKDDLVYSVAPPQVLLAPRTDSLGILRVQLVAALPYGGGSGRFQMLLVKPDGSRVLRPMHPTGPQAAEADFSGVGLDAPTALIFCLTMRGDDGVERLFPSMVDNFEWVKSASR